MKSHLPRLPRICRRILLVLLAGLAVAHAGSQGFLRTEISEDRQIAKVTVPERVHSVTLEKFQRGDGWSTFQRKKAEPGVMRFQLPAAGREIRWRAIGHYHAADPARKKFPAAYYQGKHRFAPVDSKWPAWSLAKMPGASYDGFASTTDVPVEADIWKIDGDTVYFFNQLRGLQVLNLADPADPRLMASLRLPASGQDLYLLPGASLDRELVLLTSGWSGKRGDWTTINVVKIQAGNIEITHTREVPGYLADSRLVGDRLILATTQWSDPEGGSSHNWVTKTLLSEWVLQSGMEPRPAGETLIKGESPVIAAGPGWLAVAVNPLGKWNVSDVSVFAIRPRGLVRMAAPVRTEGSVPGKFAIQWRDNVLTTISEKNDSKRGWSPTTVLENFRAWDPDVVHPLVFEGRLGKLRLAKGESLFATRFAGEKAYIVTFLLSDPLFVIDLADPARPSVAGHVEVPGWSTHLEPIGDLLFAVGWESDTVVASLFDVADAAKPTLRRRLKLGAPGNYSEAVWDEQALKVLPDAGLAMIPLTSYDRVSGKPEAEVRLVDIDLAGRDLKLRGNIAHDFDARRAGLLGGAVVSISQRVMVTADISDRDSPEIMSEVTLAWPVDRVFHSGNHLIQIEDGNWYGGGAAAARISPASDPEAILAETDLGEGTVKAADLRGGKLYILREKASAQPLFYKSPISDGGAGNTLVLDIYDASALPALDLLGSRSIKVRKGGNLAAAELLWPQPNRPAVVLETRFDYWYMESVVRDSFAEATAPVREAKASTRLISPPWHSGRPPVLLVFDTTDPAASQQTDLVPLGETGTSFSGVAAASDGLIALGTSQPEGKKSSGSYLPAVRVVEVPAGGPPVFRPLIDLPGDLFAVTRLDSRGFLAFTRLARSRKSTGLQVSACDGYDAFFIAALERPASVVATAAGRRLFISRKGGVERHVLDQDGNFIAESTLETGWTPQYLRSSGGTLLGSGGTSIFAADVEAGEVVKWKFPLWYPLLDRVQIARGGDLFVPFGDHGVERLAR